MEKRNTCELSKLSGQNDLLAVVLSTVTSRRRDNKFLWMVDERRRALSCHAEVNVHEKIKNQKNYITAETKLTNAIIARKTNTSKVTGHNEYE